MSEYVNSLYFDDSNFSEIYLTVQNKMQLHYVLYLNHENSKNTEKAGKKINDTALPPIQEIIEY